MTLYPHLYIELMTLLLSCGAIIYAWLSNRKKDMDRRFSAGSKRMDGHEERLAALEHTVKTLPAKDDFHALQLEQVKQTGHLKEIRAVMEGNAEIMKRLEGIVRRHEEHLLDGANK